MQAQNSTSSKTNDTDKDYDWSFNVAATHALNIVLLLATLCLLACVVMNGSRRKAWTLSTPAGKLYVACTATISCYIPRLILDLVYYHLHKITETLDNCELLFDISNGIGALALLATYLFLWVRQWITYNHAIIQKLTPKWICVLSWITLGVICVTAAVFTCLFVIPPVYRSNGVYCVSKELHTMPPPFNELEINKKYIVGGLLLCVQLSLLTLFIFPLIRTRMKATALSGRDKRDDVITNTIRRSFVSVALSVLSDFTGMTVHGILPWLAPLLITNTVFNVMLFVNLCCIVHTFGYPFVSIFCCRAPKEETQGDTVEQDTAVA